MYVDSRPLSVFLVKAELRKFGEVRSHPPHPPPPGTPLAPVTKAFLMGRQKQRNISDLVAQMARFVTSLII